MDLLMGILEQQKKKEISIENIIQNKKMEIKDEDILNNNNEEKGEKEIINFLKNTNNIWKTMLGELRKELIEIMFSKYN